MTTTQHLSLPHTFALTDRVAIVTGASRGIGESIARTFAAAGASVVLAGRKPEALQAVAASIREQGHRAHAVPTHMGNLEAIDGLVEDTLATFGRLDVVVNNAATNPVFGPLLDMSPDAFRKIMEVNVLGPFELARRAVPEMQRQGGGVVLNMASIGGLESAPMLAFYGASKAALINLTRSMAKEWGAAGIRVNAICPGLIKTRFSAALWENEAILQHSLEQTPLRRMGEPEDIANLALFLASDAAAYCTGGVYLADGGTLA